MHYSTAHDVAVPRNRRAALAFAGVLVFLVLAATSLASPGAAQAYEYHEYRPWHVNNMCLDVKHYSTAHGADVIQGTCWGGYNQQWRKVDKGWPYFELRPRHAPNMCLDVAHFGYQHGADVVQANCWGGRNQQWYHDGTKIKARHSGLCLDVAHGSIAHGANVLQANCWWPGYNQQWSLMNLRYG